MLIFVSLTNFRVIRGCSNSYLYPNETGFVFLLCLWYQIFQSEVLKHCETNLQKNKMK